MSKGALGPNNPPVKRQSPPASIIPIAATYYAQSGGDPRVRLKEQFTALLGASFGLKQVFPRTVAISKLYDVLLALCGEFGVK